MLVNNLPVEHKILENKRLIQGYCDFGWNKMHIYIIYQSKLINHWCTHPNCEKTVNTS